MNYDSDRVNLFRKLFLLNFTCNATIVNVMASGGVFLTAYSLYLGLNESQIGAIASFVAAANLFQLFSPYLYRHFKTKRQAIVWFSAFRYICFFALPFIPIFRLESGNFLSLLILLVLSSVGTAMIGGGLIDWNDNYVNPLTRGRYYANRNIIANGINVGILLVLSPLLTENSKNPSIYIGTFGVLLVCALVEIFVLYKIEEPKSNRLKRPKFDPKTLLIPFQDRVFRSYILFIAVWNLAVAACSAYQIVYAVKELRYPYELIGIVGSIASILKIFIAKLWGVLGDRFGLGNTVLLTGGLYSLTFFLWIFMGPQTQLLYGINTVLNGLVMIGINITIFNINIDLTDGKDRLLYMGIAASVVAICAFIGPFFGSLLIQKMAGGSFGLFGISINAFQILFLVSTILGFWAVIRYQRAYNKITKAE